MPRTTLKKPNGKKPTRSRTPASAEEGLVSCDSDSVRNRLARIESNYVKLDQLLADLEARVPQPESETDGSPADSANPKKPR